MHAVLTSRPRRCLSIPVRQNCLASGVYNALLSLSLLVQDSFQNRRAAQNSGGLTCTVLFSRFDRLRLARVVGADRAAAMIGAEKQVHMFITGES